VGLSVRRTASPVARRTFEVGEEERDGARRQLGHTTRSPSRSCASRANVPARVTGVSAGGSLRATTATVTASAHSSLGQVKSRLRACHLWP
jgi:hypothetical protein